MDATRPGVRSNRDKNKAREHWLLYEDLQACFHEQGANLRCSPKSGMIHEP